MNTKFLICLLLFMTCKLIAEEQTEKVFDKIYNEGLWGKNKDGEGTSGPGSSLKQGWKFINVVNDLINTNLINTVLDVGCGDWVLASQIDWKNCNYLGVDIVKKVIKKNQLQYGSKNIVFKHLNAIEDPLPKVDLIICKDVLVHLPIEDILKALKNFKASGSKYLLTTTFTARNVNKNITTGDWRPLNFMISPFIFPTPEFLINEECTEAGRAYSDKSLALWKLADLPL